MRDRQSEKPETCALTCPVCGALPGTSCIEDDRELAEIHPSRQISIAERNYRRHASGWEPPELAERRRRPPRSPGRRCLTPDSVPGSLPRWRDTGRATPSSRTGDPGA